MRPRLVADQMGVTLMVGHTFEFSPPVVKIKEIIESGSLGDIYYVSAIRVNLGIHQKDTSVIWDLAPHDLSMLLHWLGEPPIQVSAVGRDYVQPGIPDVAFIDLVFQSGAIANVQVSWLTVGLADGRRGLHFGANDIGSTMIEENVISKAGANHKATEDMLVNLIREEGFTPVQRKADYVRLGSAAQRAAAHRR